MNTRIATLLIAAAAFALPAAAAHDGPWYTDPAKGLAFIALLIFFAIVWRAGGFKIIAGTLDKRSEMISARIEEARALRDQATKMLAEAERKQQAANEEASEIVKRAQEDAKAMVEQAERDIAARLTRREAQAEARIARAETEAAADVRRVAADTATQAARTLLQSGKVDDPFERAASEIEKALS